MTETVAQELVPVGVKTTQITLVMPWDMDYWWGLIRSGLERMEHRFVATDVDPIRELHQNLLTGRLYAYIASEITDGDLSKPNPMGMVVLAPANDVGTNGRILWVYALYAFQGQIPREVLDRGRELIINLAKDFKCGKIVTQVQDKQMERYVRAMQWFTGEERIFTVEVE